MVFSLISFPIGNISFLFVINQYSIIYLKFILLSFISYSSQLFHHNIISIPSPKESIIYNNSFHFLFPRPSRPDSHDPSLDQTNILYAYSINHKDPPQRHLWIPVLSQRQFINEWPAPLIYTYNTIPLYIIDIHINIF